MGTPYVLPRPRRTIPYQSSRDPLDAYANDRARAANAGDVFDQELGDLGDDYRTEERRTRSQFEELNRGLMETPGYTPDEAGGIVREEAFQSGRMTPGDRTGLMGDPNAAYDSFNPNRAISLHDEGNARVRAGVEGLEEGYADAIDPDRLRMSGQSVRDIDAALTSGESSARSTIDPRALSISDDYRTRRDVTDAEVDDMSQLGSRVVGDRYQGAIADLERQAAASGTVNPLALAAKREDFERRAAIEGADAAVRGRLAARDSQRGAVQAIEDTRLGAERGKSALQSQLELVLGGRRLETLSDRERLRIQAELGLTDAQMQAAADVGHANISTERDARDTRQDLERFNTATGVDIARGVDDRKVDRTKNLVDTNFNQNFDTNVQLANANRAVADARRTGEAEVRDNTFAQQKEAGGQANTAMAGRLQSQGMTNAATANATQGLAQQTQFNKSRPSLLGRVIQGGIRAGSALATGGLSELGTLAKGGGFEHGGVVTEPTNAIIGEAGPEMVVPLGRKRYKPGMTPQYRANGMAGSPYSEHPIPMSGGF